KAEVAAQIYEDLDFAAAWLPDFGALPATDYGRVTKSTAQALKARAGLFLGTFGKYHGESGYEEHLQEAVEAALFVMNQGHVLGADDGKLVVSEGDGPAHKDNVFAKMYGESVSALILGDTYPRDLETGRVALTRHLLRRYLYED